MKQSYSLERPGHVTANISTIVQHTSISFGSLRYSNVRIQNNFFILRKVVEDLSDMAY